MHCQADTTPITAAQGEAVILVGNPNVGKSVIFSRLTGRYVEVSNYPGTTVEVTRGHIPLGTATVPIYDTPGINSLLPRSQDEQVTLDMLLSEPPRVVVQVGDAKNLRRTLALTVQLAEMRVPLTLVLNMQDEAAARGIRIDTAELERRLGIEVLATVATTRTGLARLPQAISQARVSGFTVSYDGAVEQAISALERLLPAGTPGSRLLASLALAGDTIPAAFPPDTRLDVELIRRETAAQYDQPLVYVINQQRLRCVDCIVNTVCARDPRRAQSRSARLGQIATHPVWGWPILALILFAVYQFVGVLGAGTLVGFFEEVVFGEWINPFVTHLVDMLLPVALLRDFLVGDYGLVTMALSYGIAIVMPIVSTFFLAFSILEDSGYLARLAVMANRPFKAMGLNGKAVLPMVLGLGCDTMATMSTRILDTRKERLQVTLLLALGVPCSAQLGAILGMVSFINPAALILWLAVVSGVLVAVGWLASRVIPGESSDFIVELPPMRLPRLSSIVIKTLARLEWYLKEVLPLFIIGTALLFALNVTGLLTLIEQLAAPVVEGWLGLPRAATAAFLIGFLRRDYGAAGLFVLAMSGALNGTQVLVSLVVITLFVPCIANFLMIIKEFGWRTAAAVTAFIVPFAFLVGGVLNRIIQFLGIAF
jgi:ferrous iron transport protein B